MAKFTLTSTDPATIATPAVGQITFFADSTDNDIPKYMTDDGIIHIFDIGSGVSMLSESKLFSDFSAATWWDELVLFQIPKHSILNFAQIELDVDFMSAGFSKVDIQLIARDANGDFLSKIQKPIGSPVTGVGLISKDISSLFTPNVGIASNISFLNSIINKDFPVDIYARLLVDHELSGFPQTEQVLSNSYEVMEIITVADVAGSLGGKYFIFSDNLTNFYVWYDTGASVDPAIGGRTGIQILINSGDSAADVAYKTMYGIYQVANIQTYQYAADIRMIDVSKTNLTDIGAGDSGFTVSTLTQGGGAIKTIDDLIQGGFTAYVQYAKLI